MPFAAGSPTDTIARLTAEAMARDLASPVVVENVTGAGGAIAANRVAQARPDGHTLLIHHIGHATSATLSRRLPYDVQTSFVPLGLVSDAAMTIVTRPDFPAEDLRGLVAIMQARRDALNLGHSGLPGFEMSTWHGLHAPRGTPPEVVARLNRAIRAAMADDRLRTRFGKLQTQVATPEEADPAYHARFLAAEVAKWRVAIQAAGEYAG